MVILTKPMANRPIPSPQRLKWVLGGGGARKAKISKRGVPGFKVEGPFGKNWPPMMLAASPGPQLMLVMLGSGGAVRVFQGGSKG